jgi:hypothetical protein
MRGFSRQEGRRHAHSTEGTCEKRKLTDELRRRVDEILVTASLPKSTPAGLDIGRELEERLCSIPIPSNDDAPRVACSK